MGKILKSFAIASIGLGAVGVVAVAQPGQAASLVICASTTCGSPSGSTTFSLNDFEASFDVNGSEVQSGLDSPASTSVPQAGSFVDGAAENIFSGSWEDSGETTTESETVFFTSASGRISDVLNFNYSTDGFYGTVSGYVISGALTVAGLAAVGITPTATAPEGKLFTFDNAFITSSIQTAIPEPSTWTMMALGFAALGFAGYRSSRPSAPLGA